MTDNHDVVASTLLAGATGITLFTSMLPRLPDVRKRNDKDIARDVRVGELSASAITLAFGVIASRMTKSSLPLIVAVIAAGLLIGTYESVLAMKDAPK